MQKPITNKKVPKDINQLAAYIVKESTKEDKSKEPKIDKPNKV